MKITGYKKAVGEYKNWLSRDWRHKAQIMLDRDTGEVWCDTFIDRNSWKEYYDPAIISLSHFISIEKYYGGHGDYDVNMATVKRCAEICCEAFKESKELYDIPDWWLRDRYMW